MSFQVLCSSLQTRVAKELASAKSPEDRALVLTSSLYEYADSVLKALNVVAQHLGGDSAGYKQAQSAASDLLTFLVLPFISSCSTYKEGVTVLDELGQACADEVIRKRLVVYQNQIKRRWHQADPSALPINPRAAKFGRNSGGSHPVTRFLPAALLAAGALYLLVPLDLTSIVFSHWNQARQSIPASPEHVADQGGNAPPERTPPPEPSAVETAPPVTTEGEYFSYTDSKGVIHLGNRPENDPRQFSKGKRVLQPSPATATPVVINGNQVLVPVTLSYRGRSANATLLLDTGATITTISEGLAARLGVDPGDMRPGTATVADGRKVASSSFLSDSLVVGPKGLSHLRTSVLPGSGAAGHDGLLGMDFLKNFRYHVNFSRNVIEWGGK